MTQTETSSKTTLGERVFGEFSWPGGKVPPVLADKPIPVKLGFVDDVLAILPGNEHEALQNAMARWTRGVPYLQAILEPGSKRYDINGKPVEDVIEKHRHHARFQIEAKQMSRARTQRTEVIRALDAIDKMFAEPTRENLTAAKTASAEIRRIITWK